MGLLTWIVLGLIAGVLAKLVLPGRDPGGFIVTTLIGIAGAVIGGWIATRLGYGTVNGVNPGSALIAAGGAVLLLLLYRVLRRDRTARGG